MHRAPARDAHPDRADLARVVATDVYPHAGVPRQPAGGGNPELGERVDHQLFDVGDVGDGVGRARSATVFGGQRQDRVTDQLSRTVIGDVATSIHADEFRSDMCWVDENIGAQIGTRAVGEHVRMLEQQQMVGGAVAEQRLLDGEHLAVRHATEPAHMQRLGRARHQSSAPQSRVSSSSLTLTKKPAAYAPSKAR